MGVEIAGRLVSDDQVGVGDDGAGDGNALLLAAGQLPGQMARAIRKTNEIERGGDHLPASRRSNGR